MRAFATGAFQRLFGKWSCVWRCYGWEPEAVSLGYNQNPADIDIELCRADGIDVVVRPTGGRAVLHADELTYSFVAETGRSNADIYRMVHQVIARSLGQVGVFPDFCRTQFDARQRSVSPEAVACFTASARYELQVGGRKLVGSAQRRSGSVLLQHGSLPLSERHRELARYIRSDRESPASIARRMNGKTVSLSEAAGREVGYRDLVPLLISSLGKTLGAETVVMRRQELEGLLQGLSFSIH
jgi:lipoate-protein ligase A